ncbi:MAG: ADP-glyceromanno-heptose 6-epimerase [Syntrophobacterales bacterium]|nr:ADP-glyceromanno-heptose 6-epimerase [Syntrophobacterales bacterium]
MIIVTGGAGFIGSVFVWKLNEEGVDDILIVDELGESEKWKNLVKRSFSDYLHKESFLEMVLADKVPFQVKTVVHLGANSSTTERDAEHLMRNNYLYSRALAVWAVRNDVRFVYASSAATYGDGAQGFSDDDTVTRTLRPINMYGYSKHLFDLGILKNELGEKVAGVKFFNVFGPNEYHKGDMRSVVHKAFGEIRETGKVRLFKSYKPDYPDGGQMRDFIYVKDCADVLWWLCRNPGVGGIFNLGTGVARTWNDLARAVFSALDTEPRIEYVEMPEGLRDQYQYFTEARMEKLRAAGYKAEFRSLEEGVRDYVVTHLRQKDPYL